MRAFVEIGSLVMGLNGWTEGRSVEDLGIEGMDIEEVKGFLESGNIG
jgi:hypothetical protein